MHCSEEGLEADVRHEIHAQDAMSGEGRTQERPEGGRHPHPAGAPLPRQPLVLLPG